MSGDQKESVFLAIDLELSGNDCVKHFVFEFAFVAVDRNGKVIQKDKYELARQEDERWSMDTVLWMSKQPAMHNIFTKRGATKAEIEMFIADPAYDLPERNVQHPSVSLTKFRNEISNLRKKYHVILISDLPEVDIGRLNMAIGKYTELEPLHIEDGNYYGGSVSTDSYLQGMLLDLAQYPSSSEMAKRIGYEYDESADHDPLNDAKSIALNFVRALRTKSVI